MMEGHNRGQVTRQDTPSVPAASVPAQSIERLTQAINLLNRHTSLWYGFWHGLLVGIGSTVGVVLILYIAAWILGQLEFIPGLDKFREIITSIINQRAGSG